MYKVVIFDFFDVFRTDSYKAWLQANNLAHEGEYFEASHQQDLGNITTEEFLQRLSKLQGRNITKAELDANATVDREVITIAESLRKHYKTALVSNAPSAFLRQLLKEHDLERLFDEVVVSSEVAMVKPSREIFALILQRLRIEASEAIFIDDNPSHIAAAEKLGIKGIVFQSAEQLQRDMGVAGLKLGDKSA